MKVMVTGGAGFIGSHICWNLADSGHEPVILDDLSRGNIANVEGLHSYIGDIGDAGVLRRVFSENPDIDSVIHCAAFTSVPESVAQPLDYYRNNISNSVTFLTELLRTDISAFLFSSSGSIYDTNGPLMVDEDAPVRPMSPYSTTKYQFEQILADAARIAGFRVGSLRYFNPIGADAQGRCGDRNPAPGHLIGRLLSALEGGEPFNVTGTGWPTRDGSGIRDYIDILDLADAHIAFLARCTDVDPDELRNAEGIPAVNVGTGTGTTVIEFVEQFRQALGADLTVGFAPARPGDVRGVFADPGKFERLFAWKAERPLEQAIARSADWRQRMLAN